CALQKFGMQYDNDGQAGLVLLRKMFIAEHTTPKHLSFALKDLRGWNIIVTETVHSRTYTIKFPIGKRLTQQCYEALLLDLEWAPSLALNNDDVTRPANAEMPEIKLEASQELEAAPPPAGGVRARPVIVASAVPDVSAAPANGASAPSPASMPGA